MRDTAGKLNSKTGSPNPNRETDLEKDFPNLFNSGVIRNLEIKNRIIGSPFYSGLAHIDGSVTTRLVNYYGRLARGGLGLLMVENVYVDNNAAKATHCQIGISDIEHISGLSWLADTIKENSCLAGITFDHAGCQKLMGKGIVKSASAIPSKFLFEKFGKTVVPTPLLISEIKDIIGAFGQAAEFAVKSGFDLVEIQAGNGSLISNFLSPHTNKRDDNYGGPLENRARLLYSIVRAVRDNAGEEIPVIVKINGSDYDEDGFKIEESIQVCRALKEMGADAVHITGGSLQQITHQFSPMLLERNHHVWASEKIKKEIDIPVIVSGSITSPYHAEDIMRESKADFIALGRSLWADPDWSIKIQRGEVDQIIPCIRCNEGCLERSVFGFSSVTCSVNPLTGRDPSVIYGVPKNPRSILIIGGGPAGITAALLSAQKGHKVTLYERKTLGGHLNDFCHLKFRSDLKSLRDYYASQISSRSNIRVINKQATIDSIEEHKYDLIIVAIGGRYKRVSIPGINYPYVYDISAVWNNNLKLGRKIAVVDSGFAGVETALKLANKDRQITLIVAYDDLVDNYPITDAIAYKTLLDQYGIVVISGGRLDRIEKNQIFINCNSETKILEADSVVVSIDREPQREFASQLRQETNREVYEIGDCISPGRLHDAIYNAYKTVLRL